MSRLVDSQRVEGPDGHPRVRVLFYDDGSLRFRVDRTPMAIEEAFLTGNRDQHTIVKLAPRRIKRGIPDSFRVLGIKAEVKGEPNPCRVCAAVRGNLYSHGDSNAPELPLGGCEHERGCTCHWG